ncbi:uncharacterized protein AB675_7726 [Cyphellophora attinorum]|uniref:Nucleoporin NUP37 n=1 Tax=Cyphellophora attinorum TaxID=1664694 RepID=A0A0N1P0H2_9EURO|nr:uncharacterized protein AB675_7726 [Phialophora attinorum]KPI40412.1 hypothetical protein AB675_7726 [Phialophora attinorum]
MKPRVLQHRSGYQLTHDLPHRIYDAHVYPRTSSNGSTVIVYSHDDGLRIVWYAGKRFKKPLPPSEKVNGHANQATDVIDLDSDDDEAAPKPAEFDDADEAVDPAAPYRAILRHIDVPLGSAALKVAVLRGSQELSEGAPALLKDNIILAAGCADCLVRVIAVPLQPPAPENNDISRLGVQVAKLSGHQDLVSAVSVTTTIGHDSDIEDEEDENAAKSWSLLVASTSCTGSGLLLVHQVQVQGNKLQSNAAANKLIRRVSMRSPLHAAKLSFNTASHEAERHSNLLVILPDAAVVKVYQVFTRAMSRRRGSAATLDSVSTPRSTTASGVSGRFLITLHPGYRSELNSIGSRIRPLDAAWICSGRAIIAFLENGQYGIWDFEAAGPPTDTVIKNQGNVVGISGGTVSKFAVSGTLERRRGYEGESSRFSTGSIAVGSSGVDGDDAVMFSAVAEKEDASTGLVFINRYLSSTATWWKSKSSGKGSLQPNDRPATLPELKSSVSEVKGVGLLPDFVDQKSRLDFDTAPNFMLATGAQLLLYVSPSIQTDDPAEQSRAVSVEQSLLERGDLDLDGVDRYLENMQQSRPHSRQISQSRSGAKPNFGSSMISEGGMDLDSPMPALRFAPAINTTSQNTKRRIFS